MIKRSCLALSSAILTVAVSSSCFAQTSVPPAIYQPKAGAKNAAKPALLLRHDAAARRIALSAATASEREPMYGEQRSATSRQSQSTATTVERRRLPIGFPRAIPAASGVIPLSYLAWQAVGPDSKAARIELTSPDAAALRIGLTLQHAPPELRLRFASATDAAVVFGPYSTLDVTRDSIYWSPVLDGETAVIEIEIPIDANVDRATLTVPMISHLEVAGAALKQADSRIGFAGSCQIDVSCTSEEMQARASTAVNAVARMIFVDHGVTYLCTGTLLNDSSSSMTPYFFTANHCIDNGDRDPAASRGSPAATAGTINTYWFFQADVCNVHTASGVTFVQVAGGATLVARSVDYDWVLLRLNNAPPPGATFAAWNAEAPIASASAVIGIHHPIGDLKKLSQGAVRGYQSQRDGSSFIEVQWSQGVTEGGSSGSGLFTLHPSGYYELRGGLWGGSSACTPATLRSASDVYSRFDAALPHLAPSLTPTASNPTEQVLVVEFYNSALDDYFLTTRADEIANLDARVHSGWVRTGLTFLAYGNPATSPANTKPVCRFYVLPEAGDSHFYSADADECAATAARFAATWVQESDAVFYIQVPDATTGVCPANTRPVFRFVNQRNQLHHRYTAEVDVRDSIIRDGGWTQEGYGARPAQSVMCSPTK